MNVISPITESAALATTPQDWGAPFLTLLRGATGHLDPAQTATERAFI
ncbi:MAG: hypothetical protein F2703_02265 [Actinobacteria bacterium]|nr:hypothetical protein [Actinomycetota bacterium]